MSAPKAVFLPLAAAAAVLAVALPAAAHHSFAMFDQTKPVTLKGAVKSFEWSNPHAFLVVEGAPEGGKPTTWSLELTSPGNLTRMGWTKRSFNPGDAVSVEIYPLRDGQPGGAFRKATFLATGEVLGSGGSAAANQPAK